MKKLLVGFFIIISIAIVFSVSTISAFFEKPDKVSIVDISNPSNPQILQVLRSDSEVKDIIVYGRVIYIIQENKVEILTVNDSGTVSNKTVKTLPYSVGSFDVYENLYAISHDKALFLYGSSFNPLGSLSLRKSIKIVRFYDKNHIFVVFDSGDIGMIEIYKPTDPRLIWRLEVKKDRINDFTFSKGDIFAVCQNGVFFVVDISDVVHPKVVYYSLIFESPTKIILKNNVLLIFDKYGDLSFLDISDPFQPKLVYRTNLGSDTNDIFLFKDYLYTSKSNGIFVYSIEDHKLSYEHVIPLPTEAYFAKAINIEIPPQKIGSILWSFSTGSEIRSSPAYDGNNIYFASINGSVYSLEKSGSFRWSYKTRFLINSPTVIDKFGRIVVGSWDNYVYIIDASGKIVDRIKTSGDITKPVGVAGSRMYISSEDGNVYAVENGEIVWKKPIDGWVTTNIIVDKEGVIYFGTSSGKLYAYSYSGNLLWIFNTSSWVSTYIGADDNGNLYFGTANGFLYKINHNGTLVWKYSTGNSITSGVTIDSFGRVLFGTKDGALICLDRKGNFMWSYETEGEIHSIPSVSKEGFVYFGSDDSYLYSLNLDGTLRWKIQTGGKVYTSPLVLKNVIVFGSGDGKIYAITERTDGLDDGPWPTCCGNKEHNKLMRF